VATHRRDPNAEPHPRPGHGVVPASTAAVEYRMAAPASAAVDHRMAAPASAAPATAAAMAAVR
jgi:hypothetical protein